MVRVGEGVDGGTHAAVEADEGMGVLGEDTSMGAVLRADALIPHMLSQIKTEARWLSHAVFETVCKSKAARSKICIIVLTSCYGIRALQLLAPQPLSHCLRPRLSRFL